MSAFPQPWKSTVSHWEATDRGPRSLWNHGRDAPLAPEADIVIVGGGMMGAALSYFITREGAHGAGKRVVCLDAKDCGSGATGRNGGHVGPKTYVAWHELMQPYPIGMSCTEEEAVWITQSERDNLDLVQDVIEKEGFDVDFWRGELCETHHSKEETEWSKKTYHAWLAARSKVGLSDDKTSFEDDAGKAQEISRMEDVTSVHLRPGGSVHSHKLCTALMKAALNNNNGCAFSFHSWTPVGGFPKRADDGRWNVKTSRGHIIAKQVILCTNAHTPHFFDKTSLIHHHIQPFRGQCATITPPTSYASDGSLAYTYNTADGHYLVTTAGGQLILGGGVAKYIKDGRVPVDWYLGAVDDSQSGIHHVLTEDLAEFMPRNFVGWGDEAYGEGLTRTWVGIMAASKDQLPLVGIVPECDGVYLAAGFSGHGMSRIFVTARSLAHTLQSGYWDPALLPPRFELTPERLRHVKDARDAFEKKSAQIVVVDGEIVDLRTLPGGRHRGWQSFWGSYLPQFEPEETPTTD